jgi:DNA repair protein RecO (recombination protein O)
MLKKLEGIVFRTIKYSESSVICDIYTREYGLRTYIFNGVRKPKSKIAAGLVRPMSILEMEVYHREEKEINRVKEIKPSYLYQQLPYDVIRGSIGLFITELAQRTIKEASTNKILYDFLSSSYQLLDQMEGNLANFHLSFMVKLTQYLGFMPDASAYFDELEGDVFFDYQEGIFVDVEPEHAYHFNPLDSRLLIQFLEAPTLECSKIKLKGVIRHAFIEEMINFYRYYVENFKLQSHDVLHQVLS